MRSGKKSIAVLAAVLALVLAVQAFAFTAVKLGTSDAADSVEAGVTRQGMDAKPECRWGWRVGNDLDEAGDGVDRSH